MTLPTQSQMVPIFLRLLENNDYDFHTLNELVGQNFGLTEEELEKRLLSGKKTFNHNMHWVIYYLRRARLVEDIGDKKIRITLDGKKALKSESFYKGNNVNWAYLESIPSFRGDTGTRSTRRIDYDPIEDDTPLLNEEITFEEHLQKIRNLDEKGIEVSESRIVTTTQKKRNQELVRLVRSLRGDACQICGATYDTERGTFCDSHHVVPLSKGGTDTSDNIIIVCPSCHRRFHLSEFELVEGISTKAVKVPWIEDMREIEYWQEYIDENIEKP